MPPINESISVRKSADSPIQQLPTKSSTNQPLSRTGRKQPSPEEKLSIRSMSDQPLENCLLIRTHVGRNKGELIQVLKQ